MFTDYQPLALIANCQTTLTKSVGQALDFEIFPNPFDRKIQVSFNTGGAGGSEISLGVFDARGAQVSKVFGRRVASGNQQIDIDLRGFPPGNYYVRLGTEKGHTTKAVLKVGGS